MKWLRRIIGTLLVLVFVLAVVGVLLPAKVGMERSVVIDRPAEQIFPRINNLREWVKWQPWNEKRDPSVKWTFTGPESGVDAEYSWTSEKLGKGRLKITESTPPEKMAFGLWFEGDPNPASGELILTPVAGNPQSTTVTWSFRTDFGFNLVGRYFGLLLESMLGPDYETGLRALKETCEGSAETTDTPEVATPGTNSSEAPSEDGSTAPLETAPTESAPGESTTTDGAAPPSS